MEGQKKGFIQWVKAHKKELVITGVSMAAIIAAIVAIKNKDSIVALRESLRKSIDKTPVKPVANSYGAAEDIIHESVPVIETISESQVIQFPVGRTIRSSFDVSAHTRKLPDGFQASAEKIATAAEYGYELMPGQTWVVPHTKGVSIA